MHISTYRKSEIQRELQRLRLANGFVLRVTETTRL